MRLLVSMPKSLTRVMTPLCVKSTLKSEFCHRCKIETKSWTGPPTVKKIVKTKQFEIGWILHFIQVHTSLFLVFSSKQGCCFNRENSNNHNKFFHKLFSSVIFYNAHWINSLNSELLFFAFFFIAKSFFELFSRKENKKIMVFQGYIVMCAATIFYANFCTK